MPDRCGPGATNCRWTRRVVRHRHMWQGCVTCAFFKTRRFLGVCPGLGGPEHPSRSRWGQAKTPDQGSKKVGFQPLLLSSTKFQNVFLAFLHVLKNIKKIFFYFLGDRENFFKKNIFKNFIFSKKLKNWILDGYEKGF